MLLRLILQLLSNVIARISPLLYYLLLLLYLQLLLYRSSLLDMLCRERRITQLLECQGCFGFQPRPYRCRRCSGRNRELNGRIFPC